MPRTRTTSDRAAGRLILAVQKVWGYCSGTDEAPMAEAVMNKAHDIQVAITNQRLQEVLAGRTIREYLGAAWVSSHRGVSPAVGALEQSVNGV